MRFTAACGLFALAGALEHTTMADGTQVVEEYNIVTTTTTTEHVDVGYEAGCTSNCVYSDVVIMVDQVAVFAWAEGVKADYDLLMRDWMRSMEHFEFEIHALNDDYWVMFRPLIQRRREIYTRRYDEIVEYVMYNTYFHGAHIHAVVPEIEAFMREQFIPTGSNIVSMFGLDQLTLEDAQEIQGMNPTFTFGFDEDEIVAWVNETFIQYDAVTAKYEQDFDTFTAAVDAAVDDFLEGQARVEALYERTIEQAQDDADFYWEMHYDSPLAP